ncbi:McrB family protein [Halanaerobaculum tunisiense]
MALIEKIKSDLKNHQRSYKFIVYKAFLNLANNIGEVAENKLIKYFRNFYLQLKKQGVKVEAESATSKITNIEQTKFKSIKSYVNRMPLDKIDYLKKENDIIFMKQELWDQLTPVDIEKLKSYINQKIKKYYKERVGENIEISSNKQLERGQNLLRDNFNQILNTYYQARKKEDFAGHKLGDLFRHQLPELLNDRIADFSFDNQYEIKGSIGQGNWARVPWFAIMDEDITTTTRDGVYVVYLFSDDMNKLYLTFNQGVTNRSKEEQIKLRNELREKLNLRSFSCDNHINLTDRGIGQDYEESTIGYIEYEKGQLPPEDTLLNDLETCLEIYNEYKKKYIRSEQVSESLSNKEVVERIEEYIAGQGFTYPEGLIENFYLSLKTKPFVLLAGISGTGKTKLVELFAKAIGVTGDQFKIIPVKPDWSDSSDLLGYNSIKGQFNPGPMIEIIQKAMVDQDNIYFICLDEMNLARVEYYFSDLLSVMETREQVNGEIKSNQLLTAEDFTNEEDKEKYAGLYLPENLYFVGTVNMDETTHPFSKKVLDRANTIEFSQVNLDSFDLNLVAQEPLTNVRNSFLKAEYLTLKDCAKEEQEFIEQVIAKLTEINDILKENNLHIGYRVRDEICFYMLYARREELLTFESAFDLQLMQKILPRIQGSSVLIKEILVELFEVASSTTNFSQKERRIGDKLIRYLEREEVGPYPESAEKLAYMIKRWEEDGFTAYWL